MRDYFCDLHIHSCLSPCGDDEMTPANIVGMALVNGLNVVALTDHNTSKNCPAFFAQARMHGIGPIAGMELTTAEDIHVICLFPTLQQAMEFDSFVAENRIRIRNKPEVFGHQYLMDADETILGEEPDLLINATMLSLEDAFLQCEKHGGICYPAHIDRSSNGIIAALGAFPDDPPYRVFELRDGGKEEECRAKYPNTAALTRVVSSDAHDLGAISEAENF